MAAPPGFGDLVREERELASWTRRVAARELSDELGEHVTIKRWRCIEGRSEPPPLPVFRAICRLFDWDPQEVLDRLGWLTAEPATVGAPPARGYAVGVVARCLPA